MKAARSSLYIAFACAAAAGVSLSAGADRDIAAPANHAADIAVFDRVLASANPTDRWVKFGDVGIPYQRLKLYRDRLSGTPGAQLDGQAVDPNAVTPAGLTFKWPNGDVYYRFNATQVANGTISAIKMQEFRDSVAEWSAFAKVHFIEFTTPLPANYITVQEDPSSGGGFSSSVGMAGGEQLVQFGPNAWNRGTICHEVGHALGLWHEQQRPDRDTYVTINFGNIDPNAQGNFTIISDGQGFGSPYDFYSVMHYSRKTFALNPNQDTISMKPGFTQYANLIGNTGDRVLSKAERAAMAAIYGNPSSLPGSVVTNTNDSGPGSLRTSIYYAFDRSPSASPSPSPAVATTVTFNIPTNDPGYNSMTGLFTIKPTSQLPSPGSGTTINGNGQIVLDGSNFTQLHAPPLFIHSHGLSLRAANCTIKGLTIQNFDQAGIVIFQDNDPNNSASTGNLIGGTIASARNIISGNAFHGIAIQDSSTTNNLVQGNYIGTNLLGTSAQGNGNAGVAIFLGAHGNTVGGTVAGARNVISGNQNQGVLIADAGTNNNLIQGNYIGTDASGANAVPNANGYSGIDIFGGAQANTIGGTSAGARNVISGNSGAGIAIYEFNDITAIGTRSNLIQGNFIGLNAAGAAALPNQGDGLAVYDGAPSNTIGGSAAGAGNVISGNGFAGIAISGVGTNTNTVQGNFIGLNAAGTGSVPNTFDGVALFNGCQSNTIGGTIAGARNIISGNGFSGITMGGSGTTNNLVQGNIIGLNPAGTATLQNTFDGVALYGGSQSNTIGGITVGARNVISGNGGSGVTIGGNQTNNNLVQGNFIGVDATGLIDQGNGFDGIAIYGDGPPASPTPSPTPPNTGAQANTIGGTGAGARNVIAGNGASGISIGNPGTDGTNNNVVQGNYIGINAAGSAVPNNFDGIAIYGGARNNLIGGTTAGARNFISGNSGSGITISRAGANNNLIQGNTIGLNPAGSITSNGAQGIALFQLSPGDPTGPQANTIGGSAIGASNTIAGNTYEGIALYNDHTIRNQISRNSIFSNSFAGIGRYDMSNNNQPAPAITSAVLSPSLANAGGTDVAGNFSGSASTIEFFASPPGGDEGQFFIGSANVGGAGNFAVSLAASVPGNHVVTATATDANGNTSQFSFTQAVSATDSDGDGVPDNWMLAHFSHATGNIGDKSRAVDDADGDGLTNAQEFRAGTDPKSPAGRLAITAVDRSTGSPRISFQPVTGKTYRLEYRDDLTLGTWITLANGIFAPNNSVVQITDFSGGGLTKRFYRVDLEP